MKRKPILDETSLANTLWNLEEARLAGIQPDDPHAELALQWISRRHAVHGAYRSTLFGPTSMDHTFRRATPTGEDGHAGDVAVVHILGEEALRALALWGHSDGMDLPAIGRQVLEWNGSSPGHYCCYRCSVGRWRALTAVRPEGWELAIQDAIRMLSESPRSNTGHWEHYPFYYSLLALAEMPESETAALRRQARPSADRLLPRINGDGQANRFRRRALEWVLAG
jgi:hypothetical protein